MAGSTNDSERVTRYARYLDRRSLVLRMINLVTSPPSSLSFSSHFALLPSLARASRPRIMAFSKFLRKSFLEPRKFGLAKLRREKYSERSFWPHSERDRL